MNDLVLTLIGTDRPGIVEALAQTIASHGGNWLESRMAHLAGKFAGVLRIEAPDDRMSDLQSALRALEGQGLTLVLERSGDTLPPGARHTLEIELLGLDRPGLVRQISDVLAKRHINVEELATDRVSAPMSGDLLFRAKIRVDVPASAEVAELRQALEHLAMDLMVEVSVAEGLGPGALGGPGRSLASPR